MVFISYGRPNCPALKMSDGICNTSDFLAQLNIPAVRWTLDIANHPVRRAFIPIRVVKKMTHQIHNLRSIRSGKVSTPKFLGAPINFSYIKKLDKRRK